MVLHKPRVKMVMDERRIELVTLCKLNSTWKPSAVFECSSFKLNVSSKLRTSMGWVRTPIQQREGGGSIFLMVLIHGN